MLIIAFILSTIALILQSLVLPRIAILAFAPFLALAMMRYQMKRALWLSVLAGIMADLLSDDPMGLHALNYAITCGLLFKVKKHFLHDQPFHLSLYTAFVSSLSTALQLILLFLFDRRVPFDGRWIFADLVGMPVIDAFYAFVWFAAPLLLFDKLKRMWGLFWLKRKNLSRTSH